jgi:L-threonylcarbamoyladenylate synthase
MDDAAKGIQILKDGGVVIFPTDTAFGIGCRMDDEATVKRLFALRKRPETQAPPLLASSLRMLEPYLLPVPDDVVAALIEPHWPGALTIVLQCKTENVLPLLQRDGTIGVRVPNHLITLALINGVGVPILGPSANFHGGETPYRFEDLDPELVKQVDYVVRGECIVKKASTVIDCTQNPWKILRQGAVHI